MKTDIDKAHEDDREHCYNCSGTFDEETGEHYDDAECVCCECCCTCLACEYGPRDGVPMTGEQRQAAADFRPNLGGTA